MSNWPRTFDFKTDKTCQRVFKPFIERGLNALADLDAQRPAGTAYIFHEHAQRVAGDVKSLCLHLGLGEFVAGNMYWAALPHDIGKTSLPAEIWDVEDKPDETLKNLRRTHTDLGLEIVAEELSDIDHPFKDLMCDIMAYHHEQLDDGGYRGLTADQISKPVRLVAIVEAFDGWSIPRPHFGDRDISPAGVIKRMREEKMHMFDADLFEAFAEMKLGAKTP